jgi:hypothetical protein
MKKQNLYWALCLTAVLTLAIAPATWAQGDNPFEVNADVDNDGVVGPTDIQRVINDALGLNDRGPDAIDLPLRQYIVASPRASLSLLPGSVAGEADTCETVGAATNFPRRNGRLLVRKNTGIAFRYDRNVEGVWHKDACGLLRSELVVEIQPIPPRDPDGEGDDTEPEPNTDVLGASGDQIGNPDAPWHLIGRDGAAGRTCGPAIGTANIGVRHLFGQAGDFLVRSTIRTFAIPEGEIVAEGDEANFCGAVRAVNRVFTHVRVVDRRADDGDLNWQTDDESGAVGSNFGTRLDNEPDATVELP